MNSKNKKLKIAIAGLGFGKKVHLEALKESNYLTPFAIYHYDKKQKSILEKETGLEFFHDWEDLYQNTKQWEESSTGWVNTMTKSKENKAKYQEYLETTENPMIYRDWLKQNTEEQ